MPSDLYVANTNADERPEPNSSPAARGATGRRRGRRTARAWRSSPTGSRRGTSSRTRCPPRRRWRATRSLADPRPARPRASPGRATASRLLVLAADPGSYGLDWSARAVNGAEPPTDPLDPQTRRRAATTLPDRPRLGRRRRGRPTRPQRVGVRLGRRRHRRRASCPATTPGRVGTRVWSPGSTSHARTATPSTSRRGRWRAWRSHPTRARVVVVEGYASDHGLLSGSVIVIDLPTTATRPTRGRTCRRWAWHRGATTIPSGTRAPKGPGPRAAGSGWTVGARSGGAATRSSATP